MRVYIYKNSVVQVIKAQSQPANHLLTLCSQI